jgi:hypothetical protein
MIPGGRRPSQSCRPPPRHRQIPPAWGAMPQRQTMHRLVVVVCPMSSSCFQWVPNYRMIRGCQ